MNQKQNKKFSRLDKRPLGHAEIHEKQFDYCMTKFDGLLDLFQKY